MIWKKKAFHFLDHPLFLRVIGRLCHPLSILLTYCLQLCDGTYPNRIFLAFIATGLRFSDPFSLLGILTLLELLLFTQFTYKIGPYLAVPLFFGIIVTSWASLSFFFFDDGTVHQHQPIVALFPTILLHLNAAQMTLQFYLLIRRFITQFSKQ